mmetsp:Transcript_124909/g.400110  ORF Transcript_124909/g.400110 Transcript_124909/m.400110 type:complete len:102 (+) Transcript_124909:2774-3079(+)
MSIKPMMPSTEPSLLAATARTSSNTSHCSTRSWARERPGAAADVRELEEEDDEDEDDDDEDDEEYPRRDVASEEEEEELRERREPCCDMAATVLRERPPRT